MQAPAKTLSPKFQTKKRAIAFQSKFTHVPHTAGITERPIHFKHGQHAKEKGGGNTNQSNPGVTAGGYKDVLDFFNTQK